MASLLENRIRGAINILKQGITESDGGLTFDEIQALNELSELCVKMVAVAAIRTELDEQLQGLES